jgi:hypothetical protein
MTEEKISSIKIGAAFAWNETNHSNKSAIAHHVDGIRGIRGVLSAHLRAVQVAENGRLTYSLAQSASPLQKHPTIPKKRRSMASRSGFVLTR